MDRDRKFDQIVRRTTRRLAKELNAMAHDLDEQNVPQRAFECVLITLQGQASWMVSAMLDLLEQDGLVLTQGPSVPRNAPLR